MQNDVLMENVALYQYVPDQRVGHRAEHLHTVLQGKYNGLGSEALKSSFTAISAADGCFVSHVSTSASDGRFKSYASTTASDGCFMSHFSTGASD